jgi:hypothetical protein
VAGFRKVGDGFGRFRFVAPDDGEARASLAKPARHAKPNAAIATGDDRNLAVEVKQPLFHDSSSR